MKWYHIELGGVWHINMYQRNVYKCGVVSPGKGRRQAYQGSGFSRSILHRCVFQHGWKFKTHWEALSWRNGNYFIYRVYMYIYIYVYIIYACINIYICIYICVFPISHLTHHVPISFAILPRVSRKICPASLRSNNKHLSACRGLPEACRCTAGAVEILLNQCDLTWFWAWKILDFTMNIGVLH